MYPSSHYGGKNFPALLTTCALIIWTAGSATAQGSDPTLGFSSTSTETITGSAEVALTLVIPGGDFISALQFDIETDDATLVSMTAGEALDNFEVDSRTIASGATRVIAYAASGKLTPKTYNNIFVLGVTTTGQGTITISNLIGAADSDFGEDANLQAGTSSHTITLALSGDVNGDFVVDLSDVAQEIDAIYDPDVPGADVYPWQDPDGQIDVRDLLLLVRAVLAGEWPDGSSLNPATAGKNESGGGGVLMSSSSDISRLELRGSMLMLEPAVPIKVLMVTLHGGADTDFNADPSFNGTVMKGTHRTSGALRVMFYRMDGAPLTFEGAAIGMVTGTVRDLDVEAVSMDGEKISIEAGITTVDAESDHELPQRAFLSQNYPNPFNPTTQFELELPVTQRVEVVVFDLFGRQVATLHSGVLSAGTQSFRLDGSGLSNGQYFYRAHGEHFQALRTMILMK